MSPYPRQTLVLLCHNILTPFPSPRGKLLFFFFFNPGLQSVCSKIFLEHIYMFFDLYILFYLSLLLCGQTGVSLILLLWFCPLSKISHLNTGNTHLLKFSAFCLSLFFILYILFHYHDFCISTSKQRLQLARFKSFYMI